MVVAVSGAEANQTGPLARVPQVLPHHIGHWLRDHMVVGYGFNPFPPVMHDVARAQFKVRALRAAMARVAEESWHLRVMLAEARMKHASAWASIQQFRDLGDDGMEHEVAALVDDMEDLVERVAALALE